MNHRNLLPPHHIAARRRRRAARRWVVIDGAYLGVLLLIGSVYAMSLSDPADADDGRDAAAEVDRLTHTLVGLKKEVGVLDTRWASVQEVTERPDWSVLLAALARTLGDDVVLNAVECAAGANAPIDASPQRCLIGGVGQSQAAVTQFAVRVEKLGLFSRVKLAQTASQAFAGRDGVGFQLVCEFADGGHTP